ncbi:MAG: hypothetical protein ACRDPY_47405 [Streptosporangiaceae bacterium]
MTTGPAPPSRYDGVTIRTCPGCGQPFTASGRRRWCSDACKQAAWRRRGAAVPEPPAPPRGTRRAVTVYECGSCGYRALGSQRCDECGTFMHAIGPGGLCPGCDEPVAARELSPGNQ